MSRSSPDELAKGFFALVVDRPVAVLMLFLGAAVFGLVSYSNLPLELMPDISYPTLTVRTEYPGAAPEEVESRVSRPIEEQLATVDGVVDITSRSRAESSDVVLEFTWGSDMDAASQTIRERMQQIWFGEGIERPLLLRYDPSLDPILRVAVAREGEGDLYGLRDIAEQELKPALEAMEGVAAARVQGGLERQVLVEVREDWLAARGITQDQVRMALQSENVNLAGGKILEGQTEYLIRTLGELRGLDDIRSLEIARQDGTRVAISEVASVREASAERKVVSHLDGREAVEIEIFKEADANIVEVSRRVKTALGLGVPVVPEALEQHGGGGHGGRRGGGRARGGGGGGGPPAPSLVDDLPDGIVLEALDDQAAFIEAAINNLRSTAIFGGFLAVIVLFLFLRDVRSTAIIATAIPISVVGSFAALYLGGVSLNLMSLGGLALGIGMLVDNAVVVLESIQVQREAGSGRREAALLGVREVAAAVTASTLTTVAVFGPIGFVEGIAGQLFGDLATAVVFSLLASLVVALVFVPMLAAREVKLPAVRGGLRELTDPVRFKSVRTVLDSAAWDLDKGWRLLFAPYQLMRFLVNVVLELVAMLVLVPVALGARVAAVSWGLFGGRAHRLALWTAERFGGLYDRLAGQYRPLLRGALRRPGAVLGLAALALLASWGLSGTVGKELIPEVHQGRFAIETALPVGTPLVRNVAILEEAERLVAAHPDVERVYAAIGSERRADSRSDEGEHSAKFLVQLSEGGDLVARERQVMADLRQELDVIERLDTRFTTPSLFSFKTPIEVVLTGRDLDVLGELSGQALGRLERTAGLRDVSTSLAKGYPEVRIRYDRLMLHRFGLSTSGVAGMVRDKVQGADAGRLVRGERRLDMLLRLQEQDRGTIQDLADLNVNPKLVPPIPLSSVAVLDEGVGPSEIRRVGQQRAAVLSASLDGFDLASAGQDIASSLDSMSWPAGYDYTITGQAQEMERSLASLGFALALAVFLVYAIMASTFESLVHPFVILFSLPLAAVGVVGTLALTGTTLSVVAVIGVIVLAGVVVNNAIVLVDYVNRLRSRGLAPSEAVLQAGTLRLRPILITTTTTVLGLLPLAVGVGEGSEIQQPLALTVIGGLVSSTLLTLVVVPVIYLLVTRAVAAARRPAAAPLDGEPA